MINKISLSRCLFSSRSSHLLKQQPSHRITLISNDFSITPSALLRNYHHHYFSHVVSPATTTITTTTHSPPMLHFQYYRSYHQQLPRLAKRSDDSSSSVAAEEEMTLSHHEDNTASVKKKTTKRSSSTSGGDSTTTTTTTTTTSAKKAIQQLSSQIESIAKGRKVSLLIDGTPLIVKAYHGTSKTLLSTNGIPINAVFTYVKTLLGIVQNYHEWFDHVGVFFDSGRPSFRATIDENYKGNRSESDSNLKVQFPIAKRATELMGLPVIEKSGFESDDLIATFATRAKEEGHLVVILGSDKDLIQLVSQDQVIVLNPTTNTIVQSDDVSLKYGVPPEKFTFYQALVGDAVDNVKGVPSIGPLTAPKLVSQFNDIEDMIHRIADTPSVSARLRNLVLNHQENARMAHLLVTLDRNVETEQTLNDLDASRLNLENLASNEEFLAFLRNYEFKSIINQLTNAGKKGSSAADTKINKSLSVDEYELIDCDEKLDQWINTIKQKKVVSFKTQLSVHKMHENNLIGVSFAVDPKHACYIPLQVGEDIDFLTSKNTLASNQWFQRIAREVFEDASILKVGHNVKENIKNLHPYGVKINNFDDIMVMSYVLNCGKHNHDFDTLIQHKLGEDPKETLIPEKEVLGIGKKKVSFAMAPISYVTHFVGQQADYTCRIYDKLQPELSGNKKLTIFYNEIEKPLVSTLAAIELKGVCVDQPGLERMQNEYAEKIFETANLIRKEAGYPEISKEELHIPSEDEDPDAKPSKSETSEEFNVNSNRQLGDVIFNKLGSGKEYAKRSQKSNDYVLNSETLQLLSSKGIAIADYILQYRAMTKLYSTYIFGLQQHINPYTNRIHTTFQNALTVTGRLSSVSPNLQNIPIRTAEGKMIRRSFIAPEGHVIMKVDYSQVELRILAHIARIDVLRDAFKNGKDVHAITASQVFKVPVQGMEKSLRNKAKAINFGIIYGMSEYGLAKRIDVEVAEAKRFINSYFQQYPGIQKYMENTKSFCREHGYVNTLFGRKCWIPDINSENGSKRGFAERTCINTPIQGTSADITKIAMNRLYAKFTELQLKTKMIIQVHDEIVFEVPLDEVEIVKPIIRELMEGAANEVNFSVPLTVDIDVSQRWLNDQGE